MLPCWSTKTDRGGGTLHKAFTHASPSFVVSYSSSLVGMIAPACFKLLIANDTAGVSSLGCGPGVV